ncbi:hypothetical protein ThrDRAFT_03244 [Frankia casuarinae]|nr:hypothetical protein ThrDRAFT_03244 [Frankia casuarinae]KDA41611.1 hypothetical protein BMG523Draft_03549 [Frankia sp. BMG5.23]
MVVLECPSSSSFRHVYMIASFVGGTMVLSRMGREADGWEMASTPGRKLSDPSA